MLFLSRELECEKHRVKIPNDEVGCMHVCVYVCGMFRRNKSDFTELWRFLSKVAKGQRAHGRSKGGVTFSLT